MCPANCPCNRCPRPTAPNRSAPRGHLHAFFAPTRPASAAASLPHEPQITHHRHRTSPVALPDDNASGVMLIIFSAAKNVDRRMCQITRRDHMRQAGAVLLVTAPALRQMHLQTRPVLPAELAERMQRLHHASALRPATAHARRQRHDGHFAILQLLCPTRYHPAVSPSHRSRYPGRTSSIFVLAGKRFCGRSGRSSGRCGSARAHARSNAFCSSNSTRLWPAATSRFDFGSNRSKTFCTTPRKSVLVRLAAANLSNSARRNGGSATLPAAIAAPRARNFVAGRAAGQQVAHIAAFVDHRP